MEQVGELERSDELVATIDRRTQHYATALDLARQVLRSSGRTVRAGPAPVWTFLIRTPDAVEAGIRATLRRSLPEQQVNTGRRTLRGSSMTINPDLLFVPSQAVGDVKYKLLSNEWNRSDLYQLVAFATGFGVPEAAIFGFVTDRGQPPTVGVGETTISTVSWPADPALAPTEAEVEFIDRARAWLELVASRHPGAVEG